MFFCLNKIFFRKYQRWCDEPYPIETTILTDSDCMSDIQVYLPSITTSLLEGTSNIFGSDGAKDGFIITQYQDTNQFLNLTTISMLLHWNKTPVSNDRALVQHPEKCGHSLYTIMDSQFRFVALLITGLLSRAGQVSATSHGL